MTRLFILIVVACSLVGCMKNEEKKSSESASGNNASKVYDQLGDSPRLKK